MDRFVVDQTTEAEYVSMLRLGHEKITLVRYYHVGVGTLGSVSTQESCAKHTDARGLAGPRSCDSSLGLGKVLHVQSTT